MPRAESSHILVKTEQECLDLKKLIEDGANFGELAYEHSKCPSGKKSQGSLGVNEKGRMVPEFDEVCFNGELHKVHGPIKTQFGYHLILVTDRGE